jgi:hypothetical protein
LKFIFVTIGKDLAKLVLKNKILLSEALNLNEENSLAPQTTPEIPRTESETILVLGYGDYLNIEQYNQGTCDGPTFCVPPEEILNQAEIEITPRGMLYYLAQKDLDSCMLPDSDTVQDAIRRTPVHLREGYWGPYYMKAYWDLMGTGESDSEQED